MCGQKKSRGYHLEKDILIIQKKNLPSKNWRVEEKAEKGTFGLCV